MAATALNTQRPDSHARAERFPGIDLLRIAASFMVVLLHLSIWTELDGPVPDGAYRAAARFLRAECVCAVDLFVLASGFLLATRPFRFARIALLALQVYLTSFVIRLAAIMLSPASPGWDGFFRDYWFWNAYLVIAFLSPLLNAALRALHRAWPASRVRLLLAGLALAFAFIPLPGGLDFVKRGYSGLWFIVPYLIGAEIALERQTGRSVPAHPWRFEAVACLLPLLGWAGSSALRRFPDFAHLSLNGSYASPIVLAAATAHLLFFTSLHARPLPRPVRLVAATAFGVYLIHANPLAQPVCRQALNAFEIRSSAPALLASQLLFGLLLYAMCAFLDALRFLAFRNRRVGHPSKPV